MMFELILLFHSVLQPITIIFSLLLSVGGVATALIVTQNPLSMPVLIGILSEDALGGWSVGVLPISGQGASFVAAGAAFVIDIVVSIVVTMVTRPKDESELRGLVYSLTPKADFHDENEGALAWYQQPTKLAAVGLVMVIILNILFW